MGKKPLMALAGLCLAGAALCGCQPDRQTNNGWNNKKPSGMQVPPPSPPPGPGTTGGATSWDTSSNRNTIGRPGTSDLGSSGLGSGAGSGNAFGSTGLGGASRQPMGGLTGNPTPGFGNSSSMNSNPALGGNLSGTGSTGGLARTGGMTTGSDPHLADPPPAPSLTGSPSAAGMGGSSGGFGGSLAPPPPPAGARPMTGGGLNLGGDAPAGSGPTMSQSNVIRTAPPALSDSAMPPPPPVPPVQTMKGNGFDQ
jgi:hypothetical protein